MVGMAVERGALRLGTCGNDLAAKVAAVLRGWCVAAASSNPWQLYLMLGEGPITCSTHAWSYTHSLVPLCAIVCAHTNTHPPHAPFSPCLIAHSPTAPVTMSREDLQRLNARSKRRSWLVGIAKALGGLAAVAALAAASVITVRTVGPGEGSAGVGRWRCWGEVMAAASVITVRRVGPACDGAEGG